MVDVLSVLTIYFNSRPSARGDVPSCVLLPQTRNFNSRPSARGDKRFGSGKDGATSISIHAPPRGATHVQRR